MTRTCPAWSTSTSRNQRNADEAAAVVLPSRQSDPGEIESGPPRYAEAVAARSYSPVAAGLEAWRRKCGRLASEIEAPCRAGYRQHDGRAHHAGLAGAQRKAVVTSSAGCG